MRIATKRQAGFGLIEVIVSITIMTTILVALTYLSQSSFRAWEGAQSKTIAYNLLQRTIEELHNKRDTNIANGKNWDTDFNTLIVSGKEDTINNKKFTTTVQMQPISVSVNINGTPTTKPTGLNDKFTVTVTWKDRTKSGELKGETYLTDWKSKY